MVAETRAALRSEPVSDEVLMQRVRAALGRALPHARVHSLQVQVTNGCVKLQGMLDPLEERVALAAARRVRGVQKAESYEQPRELQPA